MEAGYPFDPARFKLGQLCDKGHDWNGTGQTLRRKTGRCVRCQKERQRHWYLENQELEIQKAKERQKKYFEADPVSFNAKKAAWVREHRKINGRESRSKHAHLFLAWKDYGLDHEQNMAALRFVQGGQLAAEQVCRELIIELLEAESKLQALLKPASKRLLSVATLVHQEQIRYWKENPDERRAAKARISRNSWKIRYLTDKNLRLYTRQRSRRRKAMMRKSMALQVVPMDLRKRFAEFGDLCAYCGAKDDLHMEHVVPISKGGPHSIGNIIPACKSCNFSKRDHEVESWYRDQPFFSETRWRKICKVLGWHKSAVGQLAFL